MGLSPFLKFSEPQLFHLLVVFMLPLFISSPVTEKGLELSIVSLSTLKLLEIAIYCHCNGIAVEIRNILLPKLINILQSISYLTALRYLTFLTMSSFLLRLWMIFSSSPLQAPTSLQLFKYWYYSGLHSLPSSLLTVPF